LVLPPGLLLGTSSLTLAGRLAPPGLCLLSAGLDPVAWRKANFELDDLVPDRIGALVVGYRQ
jgi:hypothetical protein